MSSTLPDPVRHRSRRFTASDQRTFAALSGDWNPIHMDPVYARRTVAGQQAVHGVHMLLWALDAAVADAPQGAPSRIAADFTRFVLVDESVALTIEHPAPDKMRLLVIGGDTMRTVVTLTFGAAAPGPHQVSALGPTIDSGTIPIDTPLDAIEGMIGQLSAAGAPHDMAAAFPAAAAWIGVDRLAALAATTRLVGMVCPGLHSLFTSLDVSFCTAGNRGSALDFRMSGPRHGLVSARVSGGGIAGTLTCLSRRPPRLQASMAALGDLIDPTSFAGSDSLIIGGSRGLGEATAKIIAAGGGAVTLTYADGEADAVGVSAEICAAGGCCAVLPYRVGKPAAAQLAALAEMSDRVYYYATPTIARPPGSLFFDPRRLADLQRIFVEGFWELVSAVYARRRDVGFFYPSTVYVENRPRGLAEYAMAKAAGELLCAEINATMAPAHVLVERLPRLPTDQTAGILGAEENDPISTLLPIIHRMQAR